MTGDEALVSATDIARLTGLGRAAVSNWRRRHDDFPKPVAGTAGSPLFALPEVESWLAGQGKPIEIPDEERVWQLIRSTTDDLRLGEVVGALGRTAYFPEPSRASAAVPERLVLAARRLRERRGPQTYEYLVQRFVEAHARRVATTPASTARLMAALAGVAGRRVYDPACGIGTLLVAAGQGGARRLAGQDRERHACDITRARSRLHGDADLRTATGDSLTRDGFPGEHFDVGLCDPPFGDRSWGHDELAADPRWIHGLPPRGEPELAWVQHMLWHLVPGGAAAVLMPQVAADRRSGRRIRAHLLRSGTLRAVIGLPPGSAAGSPTAPHLWLLRRPAAGERPPDRVLMLDASALPEPDLQQTVTARWESFLERPNDDGQAASGRAVAMIDLLDDAVDLTPARHLPQTAIIRRDFEAAGDRFRERLAAVNAATAALMTLTEPAEGQPMTTVGELVRAGTVTILHPPLRMELDTGDVPVLTPKDIAVGRGPTGRTHDAPALVMLEPGDVVLPTIARQLQTTVVEAGMIGASGVAAGPAVLVFRPDGRRCDPYFLACVLHAAGRVRLSSVTSRADVRRVTMPRLTIETQRSYGEAYRRLRMLSPVLRDLIDAGDDMVVLGLRGLGGGALVPG